MDAPLNIILASSSPRRREILERLGLSHRVVAPSIEERRKPGEVPETYVCRVAREKAEAVVEDVSPASGEGPWVLAADTVVVLDGEPLGKPADAEEARQMLAALSGRDHTVLTAFCVVRKGRGPLVHLEATRVWFRELEAEEIAAYVASGEPLDKAGAYGIQGLGCVLVTRIEGNYDNVMGLPATPLILMLKEVGAVSSFPVSEGPR